MSSNIWTREVRDLLYRQVVDRFGAWSTWEKAASPGNGNDALFDKYCSDFAVVIGAKSGKAVKHQIYFAMPVKGKAHWGRGHAYSAIVNLAAALHAGFISFADVPSLSARPH